MRFWKGKGREEKGLKRTGCKTEKKKRIKYKENTVPITPVWKLSYKNHIQGQEEQSIMLVLIAIYTKARNKNYYDTIAPKFSSPLLRHVSGMLRVIGTERSSRENGRRSKSAGEFTVKETKGRAVALGANDLSRNKNRLCRF